MYSLRPTNNNNQFQFRARAEHERRKRGTSSLDATRYDPARYIQERLGWTPWRGTPEQPGQMEVLDAYVLALRQQHERDDYEQGRLTLEQLRSWQPGQVIRNRIRVEAGHTVGKTKLSSGIVNHFFDHFVPCSGYGFAPGYEQIHDLLFKEIKTDRRGKGLPGRILDLALDRGDDHFFKGKATNNAHGQGTERAQGQHGKYLIFVLDEAEGIADFVWDAIDSMASGGIVLVLMLANPRTRTSQFYKQQSLSNVASFRISCVWHPNVLAGRELIPGAVRRQYVESMVEKHCEVVVAHDEDSHTFVLPFAIVADDLTYAAGTIFKPNAEFMFRVLGTPPANIADNTFLPVGRYEAATKRRASGDAAHSARIGVDVARYGKDAGTVYVHHAGRVYRAAELAQQDTTVYLHAIKREALALAKRGVTSLHIRVDGGGGFGGGVIDDLRRNLELIRAFDDFQVFEVHFNGEAYDKKAFADLATEMYAHTAEALRVLALDRPPTALLVDLCERTYTWVKHLGVDVKRLTDKEAFKKHWHRSPDDGDGCVLSVAPDYLFKQPTRRTSGSYSYRTY